MSTNEVNELVVAMRPEGVDETTEGLQDAQESFEETAETADEESQNLEQFSQRFKGAMAVATTALAIGAAGLLSKIPIIGEFASGVEAILTSLGLKVDQLLRDLGFEGVNKSLFKLSKKIDNADGAAGDFIGTITLLTGGLLALEIAAFGAGTAIGFFKSTLVGGAITKAIMAVVGAIGLIGLALLAAIVFVVLFAAAYATNFMGTRDVTNAAAKAWIEIIKAAFNVIRTAFEVLIAVMIARWDFLKASVIARTKELANEGVKAFFGFFNSVRQGAVDMMNDMLQTITKGVNLAISRLNQLKRFDMEMVAAPQLQAPTPMQAPQPFQPRSQRDIRGELRSKTAAADLKMRTEVQDFAQTVGEAINEAMPEEIRTQFNIDGREIAEQVSRWTGESVANRGR